MSSEWEIEQLDLAAYLDRLGYDGDTAPTAQTLAALHRAHRSTIAFENLDVVLGRGITVDLDSVQAKLVQRRRGGYCYEHGVLFAAALERLGFAVQRLLARVGDVTPPRARTHMALRVQADGKAWLADVGFGSGLLEPLAFDGGPRAQGGWTFDLAADGDRAWRLYERIGGQWPLLYAFADERVYPADVVMSNHFTATWPRSPFVTQPVIVRRDDDMTQALAGRTFAVTRPDGSNDERELSDSELRDAIQGVFGVPLDDEELRRVVAAASSA